LKDIIGYVGLIGLFLVENCYINPKYKLSKTFASRYLSNVLTLMLIIVHFNTNILMKKEGFFGLGFTEFEKLNLNLIWLIWACVVVVMVFVIIWNKYLQLAAQKSTGSSKAPSHLIAE